MSVHAQSLRSVLSARPAAAAAPEAEAGRRRWDRASSGRVTLVHFAVSGLTLLAVAATIGAVALRHAARDEALRDARALTAALGYGVIQSQI